jgi:hypothetical protein
MFLNVIFALSATNVTIENFHFMLLVVSNKLFDSVIMIVSAEAGFKLREYVAFDFAGWLE